MIDKNECNISEDAKDYLTEKYGSGWEIEASGYTAINNHVCTYCVFGDEWNKKDSKVCTNGSCNNCSSYERKDNISVVYKLTDEFKKKLEQDEILIPDFSLAEVGDKVQNLNLLTGTIACINDNFVKIILDEIGQYYFNKKGSSCDLEGYNLSSYDNKKSFLPQWFYGSFKQFPTKENCVPPTREVKAVKKTVAELEKELGYKLEIVSEK